MSDPDILATVTPVVEAFEHIGIPYYIGGSVVSSTLGVMRATADADLVADLRPAHVRPLVERLQETYYIDEEMIRDAIARQSSFNIIHLDTMLKVDVFILKRTRYDTQAFRRAIRDTLEETEGARTFNLAAPEDIILHMLQGFKMGGGVSDRQWTDALGVLKVQAGALDMNYLRRWAEELGIANLLRQALEDAGLEEA